MLTREGWRQPNSSPGRHWLSRYAAFAGTSEGARAKRPARTVNHAQGSRRVCEEQDATLMLIGASHVGGHHGHRRGKDSGDGAEALPRLGRVSSRRNDVPHASRLKPCV